jgi:hypothetical protein
MTPETWENPAMAYCKHYLRTCLKGLRKPMGNLEHSTFSKDSNKGPPESLCEIS